jgi:PAS domain S-box-containing protein
VAYTVYKRIFDWLWIATLGMVAFWCLGYALQVSGADFFTVSFWYRCANDFVGWKSPVVWFLWALTVAGQRITRQRVMLLFAIPVVTDVLNVTNHWHGLVYRRMWLDTTTDFPTLLFECGPWYWVITAYCCLLLVAVIAVQIRAALHRQLLHREQGLVIAAATAIVLMFIIVTVSGQDVMFANDLTPVVIGIAATVSGLAFRFRPQEAVPVPRNAVMEKMTNAVLILDHRHRIMDMNPAAEAFFGLKAAKTVGQTVAQVLSDWPELVAASRDKSISNCEISREGRHYEAYISVLREGRQAAGFIVVVQDVTDQKAVEAELSQQQQALLVLQERERLARELHDSLGQVLGYTNNQIQAIRDMLKTGGKLPDIDRSLVRLSHVITEANTEVREFIYEVKTTLLFKEGFFAALQQYLTHFEQNFQIRVEMHNPDHLTEDELDLTAGMQLFRIIQEALANVRKHAQADQVEISFAKQDEQILIAVRDNGVGFDVDQSVDQYSYGLEVMRERAEQIGGEVQIDTSPGMGTTVKVFAPRFAKPQQVDLEVPGKKTRVLLADDHILFMEGLKNLLTPHGFEIVGTARDGLEALEKARVLQPDMILMDMQMPRCSGLAATRLIKAEMPEIKVVILTMSDQEQDLFTALQSGASGYLLKGMRAEELIEQLNSLAVSTTVVAPGLATQVLEDLRQEEAAAAQEAPVPLEEVLSPRQIEILGLIVAGCTYKEVAARLFVSERTVKYQMAAILKQLQVENRHQAIEYARKAGLGKKH